MARIPDQTVELVDEDGTVVRTFRLRYVPTTDTWQQTDPDLLGQVRNIVSEYRNGKHWSSKAMERICELLGVEAP